MTTEKANRISFDDSRVEFYSDLANDFTKNPKTGLLSRVTNEQSVAQSLRNLVLTTPGERFYDMDKGSDVADTLFENFNTVDAGMDPGEEEFFKQRLRSVINRYEPRVELGEVEVKIKDDLTAEVRITYRDVRYDYGPLLLTVSVTRVR